jgi:asparagine synthetase B (glutamine-hydrolysing)
MYAERGPAFLEQLYGDVALAVLDRQRKELLLAVDRVGARSLVYCTTPTGAMFASTATALGAHPSADREIDPQAVFDFLYFHMIPSPRSIYRRWRKLLPGEAVVVRSRELDHHRYWTPPYVDDGSAAEDALAEEYRDAVRRAVRSCLDTSHGKVGAFLSGGTDSSTVAGLIGELTGEPARTYSIGFDVPGYDESSYAQIAVRHFGTDHHEYTVTPEASARVRRAFWERIGGRLALLRRARTARRDRDAFRRRRRRRDLCRQRTLREATSLRALSPHPRAREKDVGGARGPRSARKRVPARQSEELRAAGAGAPARPPRDLQLPHPHEPP